MRKITELSKQAIIAKQNFTLSNTCVSSCDEASKLYLHGHHIATLNHALNRLYINLCGYPTNVTKERLKALDVTVRVSKGKPYLVDNQGNLQALPLSGFVEVKPSQSSLIK